MAVVTLQPLRPLRLVEVLAGLAPTLAAPSPRRCRRSRGARAREFGTSTPPSTDAVPMPVPSVVRMTRPVLALGRAVVELCEAGGVRVVHDDDVVLERGPRAASRSRCRSTTCRCWQRTSTTPCSTTPGTVTPMGEPSCDLVEAVDDLGDDVAHRVGRGLGSGVSIRTAPGRTRPSSRSTGAPLMPLPPTSMPRGVSGALAASPWVRISAPESVTRMVCSNCAERRRSLVTTVHPSSHMSHSGVPRLSIGSMVNVMPGLDDGVVGGRRVVVRDDQPGVERRADAVTGEVAHHAVAEPAARRSR